MKASEQTGFIHQGDRISYLENLSYALSLFRTKMQENVHLGKALLEKLLDFQITKKENRGHFPQYLHEYPKATNLALSVKVLPIFFLIHRDFGFILGKPLKSRLALTIKRTLTLSENHSYSFTSDFILHAIKEKTVPPQAKEKVHDLSSEEWKELLFGISLLPVDQRDPFFEQEYASLFHEELGVFIGPAHQEPQEGYTPKSYVNR
ncbi:MAG TPA: hypothetical protein VLG44_00090 [Chlamydiales bacterium]|nr:hypothetical protein [Chlamydiales bacterium]